MSGIITDSCRIDGFKFDNGHHFHIGDMFYMLQDNDLVPILIANSMPPTGTITLTKFNGKVPFCYTPVGCNNLNSVVINGIKYTTYMMVDGPYKGRNLLSRDHLNN